MVACWKMPYKRRHMEVVGKPSWIFQHAMFGGWWNEIVYHLPRGSLDDLTTWDLCILVQDYQQNAAHEGKVLSLLRLRGGRGTPESLWVAPGETRPEKRSGVIKHGVLENPPFIDFPIENSPKKDRFKGLPSHVWWHRSVSDRDIQRLDFNLGGL